MNIDMSEKDRKHFEAIVEHMLDMDQASVLEAVSFFLGILCVLSVKEKEGLPALLGLLSAMMERGSQHALGSAVRDQYRSKTAAEIADRFDL